MSVLGPVDPYPLVGAVNVPLFTLEGDPDAGEEANDTQADR